MKFLYLGLLFLFTTYCTASSDESNDHLVFVTKENALACINKEDAGTCFPIRWGRYLTAMQESQSEHQSKAPWIKVKSGGSPSESDWWVKKEYVAFRDEMKPYTLPLPIKSFRYDSGELRMHFEFAENGKVYVHHQGKTDEAKVFYTPDILLFNYPAKIHDQPEAYSEVLPFKNGKVYPTQCVTGELCEILYGTVNKGL